MLVVIAIIALLISILLPGLQGAREQARAVVCGQILRDLGNGLGSYAHDNADWIPGYNTSGTAARALKLMWSANPGAVNRPDMPVQPWDWLTPLVAPQMAVPAGRTKRFKFLLERFRCPSNRYNSEPFDVPAGQAQQFNDEKPWPAVSYLADVWFQFFGQTDDGKLFLAYYTHPSSLQPFYARAANPDWEATIDDFRPRMDRVGPPARKVFVSDGTRYLPASGLLDHDVSMQVEDNNLFGSFTESGAWWPGSTAFGVRSGTPNWDGTPVTDESPSKGQNLALSYRHGSQFGTAGGSARDNRGTLNALFFDGHVQRLTDRRSRDIDLWYPTGAKLKRSEIGMTNVPPTGPNDPDTQYWLVP